MTDDLDDYEAKLITQGRRGKLVYAAAVAVVVPAVFLGVGYVRAHVRAGVSEARDALGLTEDDLRALRRGPRGDALRDAVRELDQLVNVYGADRISKSERCGAEARADDKILLANARREEGASLETIDKVDAGLRAFCHD